MKFSEQPLSPTPNNIDRNNLWFAFLLAAGLGVLGSVITAMIAVACLVVISFQFFGKVKSSSHPGFWKVGKYFLAYFLICSILAVVHYDDGSNLELIVNRLPFLAFYPLVMALTYSKRERIRDSLEYGVVLGSVLSLIFVIAELGMGNWRAEGAAGNSGPFAVSMCLAYTLCLFGLVRGNSTKQTLIMLAGATSAVVCILASGVRGMWLLIPILPLTAIWSLNGAKSLIRWKYVLGGIIIASALVYVFVGESIAIRVASIFTNLEQIFETGNFNNSFGQRLVMWDYAWRTYTDNLWIGMGRSQSLAGLEQFTQNEYGFSMSYSHFHNFIVTAMMRGGIIELMATIALLVGPLLVAWKYADDVIGHYGLAFMLAIVMIFTASGMLNITFGHDIQDSLYTYMMAVATWLVFGKSS